jgi:hypothetical protein
MIIVLSLFPSMAVELYDRLHMKRTGLRVLRGGSFEHYSGNLH